MPDTQQIEIKSGKALVEWIGTRFDEVTQKLADADGKGAEMAKGFADLKLLVDDANRTRVPGVTDKTGRLPFTKEGFVRYGMQAAHAAPLPVTRDAEGGYTAGDGPLAVFHQKSDELKILAKVLRKNTREEVRELKFFKSDYAPAYREVETMAKAAYDIQTAGEGLEWVATDMSASMVEMVRIARRVASLFESIPMAHGTLTVPSWLTDAQAYGFDENLSETGGTPIDHSIAPTTNFVMSAKGIGLALTTSKFMEEDSVIPLLPFLRRAGIQALVNGEEDAIINGDTTSPHMDADVEAVTRHVAKRWKGLRYVGLLATNPAKTDAQGNFINSDAFFRDYFLSALGKMDEYGVDPSKLTLIVPGAVNAQLLGVPVFMNMYARGNGATNVNGVMTSPFGWNYVISPYLKTNQDASGVNTSGTQVPNKTSALLVHTDSWKKGVVREINVQVLDQTRALYDQDQLVFTMRQAFIASRKMDGTEPHVADIYDIGV